MTWLIAIHIRKHWNAPQAPFAHTKAKKSSFAPEEKTSDSKNFMFGGQWSCMMPHMLLYSNSLLCYVGEEVFQLHHFESLVSSVGVNF